MSVAPSPPEKRPSRRPGVFSPAPRCCIAAGEKTGPSRRPGATVKLDLHATPLPMGSGVREPAAEDQASTPPFPPASLTTVRRPETGCYPLSGQRWLVDPLFEQRDRRLRCLLLRLLRGEAVEKARVSPAPRCCIAAGEKTGPSRRPGATVKLDLHAGSPSPRSRWGAG